MGVEPLWRSFFKHLASRGVESICLPKWFRCKWDPPQCVTVELLLGRWRLCKSPASGRTIGVWSGVQLATAGVGVACNWRLAKRCVDQFQHDYTPPDVPKFVVDLSLWGEHTAGEKHELAEQIIMALSAVRSHFWDGNFWITHAPAELVEFLNRLVHKMNIARELPPAASPVVLDPEGDCVFTEEDLSRHDVFIVGGIVDKERTAKSATARLAELLGVAKRCRIELRGSTVGVPDRINKIVEILVKTFAGASLESAILSSQAKRDRVYRLMWEIQKRGRRRGNALEISREALAEVNWLGASEEELKLALKKTRAVVT